MTIKYELQPTDEPELWTVEGEITVVTSRTGDLCKYPLDLGMAAWGTNARASEIRKAVDMLERYALDPNFGTSGRRNNDAVNVCIAAHVLGFDAADWVAKLCEHHCIDVHDLNEFEDHVSRVCEYLGSWGPDDDLGRALEKTI